MRPTRSLVFLRVGIGVLAASRPPPWRHGTRWPRHAFPTGTNTAPHEAFAGPHDPRPAHGRTRRRPRRWRACGRCAVVRDKDGVEGDAAEPEGAPPLPTGGREGRRRRPLLHRPSRREFVAWSSALSSLAPGAALGVPELGAGEKRLDTGKLSPIASRTSLLGANAGGVEPYSSVRRYKRITLANGMRVLLVNDRNALQPSAALTINGAGQFSDPSYLYGRAHLMEHIVLCSKAGSSWSNQGDFQEWIEGDYAEGFSNGFTAYEKVCFYFSCGTEQGLMGTDILAEALERFASLFLDRVVFRTCQNPVAIQQEILRVSSELDKANLFSRELYLTKSLINRQHPYSKVTLGSVETLQTAPELTGINVPKELYQFYCEKYRADQAILVVISQASLTDLEKMVQPFAATMIRPKASPSQLEQEPLLPGTARARVFPPFLLPGKPVRPMVLFRGKVSNDILADDLEKISIQWALNQVLNNLMLPFTEQSFSLICTQSFSLSLLGLHGPAAAAAGGRGCGDWSADWICLGRNPWATRARLPFSSAQKSWVVARGKSGSSTCVIPS